MYFCNYFQANILTQKIQIGIDQFETRLKHFNLLA